MQLIIFCKAKLFETFHSADLMIHEYFAKYATLLIAYLKECTAPPHRAPPHRVYSVGLQAWRFVLNYGQY